MSHVIQSDFVIVSNAMYLLFVFVTNFIKLYLFSFVETPRKFTIAEFFYLFSFVETPKYCIHHANVQETYSLN